MPDPDMKTVLKPTPQQAAILESKARITRIDARAGTGKTTTLHLLANQYAKQKILYLVFNRRAKEEAKARFPKYVDVQTIHSLAFGATQIRSRKWELAKRGGFGIHELLPRFVHIGSKQQVVATLAFEFLNYFLNSEFHSQDDAIKPFCQQFLTDKQREDFSQHANEILDVCKAKTAAWHRGDEHCPHDFYLKLAHVQGRIDQRLSKYDIILVDEGQDLTAVTLDSLRNFGGRVFLVGDAHQQLYRFRYAINAMGSFKPDAEYELSRSFRYGDKIAKVVSRFIKKTKSLSKFKIEGNPDVKSLVYMHHGVDSTRFDKGSAILSRTNLSLFESAVELYDRDIPTRFLSGIRGILYQALDTYNLSVGDSERIRDPLIKSFGGLEDFKEYAEEMEDYSRLALIKIVENHEKDMPGVIFDILEAEESAKGISFKDAVTLSTVHTAKGAEFERVYLHEDLVSSLGRELKDPENPHDDEVNIFYVGMTRAARELHLPDELRDEVKLDWPKLVMNISSERRKRPKRIREPEPEVPEHDYAVGDRVLTRTGTGDVIEVSPDGMLLIKLHDQPYKVRERRYEVKLILGVGE